MNSIDIHPSCTNDTCAIVTGGNHGIGLSIVNALLDRNYTVISTYHNQLEVSAETKEAQASQTKKKLLQRHVDFHDPTDVSRFIDEIRAMKVPVRILINNAGYSGPRLETFPSDPLSSDYIDEFRKCIDVNCWGMIALCEHVGRLMRDKDGGSILNIGAASALNFKTRNLPTLIAKLGVLPITRHYAKLYAPRVNVNAVAPGIIRTSTTEERMSAFPNLFDDYRKLIPSGELGEPKDIVNAVLFLTSKHASYITGQTLSVDGGMFA